MELFLLTQHSVLSEYIRFRMYESMGLVPPKDRFCHTCFFQDVLAAYSVTINGIRWIASSAGFNSKYLVKRWVF